MNPVWATSINLFVRSIFVPNKDSSIKQLDLFCNITIQLGHGYKPNFKLTGYGPPNGLRSETINKLGCFCTVYSWFKAYGNFLLQPLKNLQPLKTNITKKSFRRLSCEEVAKHQYLLSEVTSTLRNDPALNSYSSVRQSMKSFSSVPNFELSFT